MNKEISKPLVKFMYVDGVFILVSVPKRVITSVVYQDFNDILIDFPLNIYNLKFVECTLENYKNIYCPF